jgi:translation initiation factor 2B subunit (eIF-2B alpha/beta/delta family)
MAKKLKPTNAVKGAAAEYARRAVTNRGKQKKLLKDTSDLPASRQLGIDAAEQDINAARNSVKSAVQFASKAGANNRQIGTAYYTGAIKGAVKGAVQNMRNR